MASSTEVVELIFSADYRGQPNMRKLKRDLAGSIDSFNSGVSAVAGFTTALVTLEAAAVGTSIALASSGVEAAGKFNDSFNEISTLLTTVSDDDLANFKQAIKDYGSESTASLESVNGAIYDSISAGIKWQDSLEFMTEAERLAVAGKADLNSVVKVLTGSLNAYGKTADDAGEFSDILFNTVKNGVTTLPELADQLGQVTGLASNLNVPFDELNAVIATLTANGLNTSSAMTAVKGALSNIVKPTKAAKDAAGELGIEFDFAALQSKGFAGLMQEITERSVGNKEALTGLFGSVEGLNAAFALTSEKGAQSFQDKLAELRDSTGATETAFAKMQDNMSLIAQNLQNNMELTLGAIGEPLLDEFGDINKAISDIFKGVRASVEGDEGLSLVVDAMEQIADTVSDILGNMATNMEQALADADLSGFTTAFELINEALEGMDLDNPEGLADAITGLGNAFESLTRFTGGVIDVMDGLFEAFGAIGGFMSSMPSDVLELAGEIGGLAIAWSAMSAVMSPFIGLLTSMKAVGGIAGALGSATQLNNIAGSLARFGALGSIFGLSVWAGSEVVENSKILNDWADSAAGASIAGDELKNGLKEFQRETGNANATMADYGRHLKNKIQSEEAAAKSTGDLAQAQGDVADGAEKTRETVIDINNALDGNARKSKSASEENEALSGELQTVGDAAESTKAKLDAMEIMRLEYDLQSDRIKAETDQIKSIMDSLGETGKAAGEALSGAFDFLGSGELDNLFLFERDQVFDSIERMSKSQAEITEAQTNLAKEKTATLRLSRERMESGGALIEIDGTGLEPQLEAFMFEILKEIQVTMAADQANFLMGIE